jgi:hypothetical protein
MVKVIFKQLVSKKQLQPLSFNKVVSAGFEDDSKKTFCITFEVAENKKQDLLIMFETRTPRIYVSRPY